MANRTQPQQQFMSATPQVYQQQVTMPQLGQAAQPAGYTSLKHERAIKIMAVMQLVIGILCIIFQIINTVMFYVANGNYWYGLSFIDGFIAGGIWIGAFYVLSGTIGYVSAIKHSNCWVKAFLVLNIIQCSVMVWVLFGLSAGSLGLLSVSPAFYLPHNISVNSSWIERRDFSNRNDLQQVSMAFSSLMLILSFTQFVIAIISSGYGCCATCCRSPKTPSQVVYNPQYQYQPQGYAVNLQPSMAVPGLQYSVGYSAQPAQLTPAQHMVSGGPSQPQLAHLHITQSGQSQVVSAPVDEKPPEYSGAHQ